ncbi:MAG: hypothetical protein ACRD2L_12405, partial [Terriglobia bacterium]
MAGGVIKVLLAQHALGAVLYHRKGLSGISDLCGKFAGRFPHLSPSLVSSPCKEPLGEGGGP